MPDPSTHPAPARAAFSDQTTGLFLAAFGAATFASKGIIVKLALAEGLDPVTILTWRMIIAVPFFVAIGWAGYAKSRRRTIEGAPRRLSPRLFASCIGMGVMGYYFASFLDFSALAHISAQFNRLIMMTSPFFVLFIGAILFRRRITLPMIGALAISYCGIAAIFIRDVAAEGDMVLLGVGLGLGSALAYGLYQVLAKPVIDAMGPRLFTSVAMAAAGVAVAIHFLLTHPVSALAVSPYALGLMVAIAILSTVIPAYCISAAIGRIGSERTAVIGNISPLVTIVLAVTLLGEPFTPVHALGTALVLSGILLFTHLTRRPTPPQRVEP